MYNKNATSTRSNKRQLLSSPAASSSPSSSSSSSSSPRSPFERREILRRILRKTRAIRSWDRTFILKLEEMLKEVDSISKETTIDEKASCQFEVLMDSQILEASGQVINTGTSELLKLITPYTVRNFAQSLMGYVHTLPGATAAGPDWSMLEDEVTKLFGCTACYEIIGGCLKPLERKVVVKHQSIRREALAPTSRPEAVVTIAQDEDSIEKTVHMIKKLICDRCSESGDPLDFFRLILHPKDFGKTIENMLHVSFLVRDGFMKMMMDDNEKLVIIPCSKEMRARAKKSGKRANTQNVISLDIQQWLILNEAYKIDRPMINL